MDWIKIEPGCKMPEKGQRVFVTVLWGQFREALTASFYYGKDLSNWRFLYEKDWFINAASMFPNCSEPEPIAWAPFPEPYNE